jgi:hypothetical protein
VTNARTAGGQFIIGMQALPGSPYDGNTLTGFAVERAYVDRGYRGHRYGGKAKVNIAHRAALRRQRSGASSGGGTPSSRSSATPNRTACSNATISPALPVMRSTPSSLPPDTTCGCSSHGWPRFCVPGSPLGLRSDRRDPSPSETTSSQTREFYFVTPTPLPRCLVEIALFTDDQAGLAL